jgi:hypothetical protein
MGVRLLGLTAFVTAAALLTACGGADRAAAPPGSRQNPLVAQPTKPTSTGRSNEASAGSDGQLNYKKLVERQTSRPASRFTPCNLVSRAQASAILGGPVLAPVEAPQGPTCIFRSRSGKAFVTLAVQKLDIGRLKKQLQRRQAVGVSHHAGYCGTYGQQMLYVSLSRQRVLSIAAPCGVAKRFAAHAVARLG